MIERFSFAIGAYDSDSDFDSDSDASENQALVNTQSIRNKIADFTDDVGNNKFDFVAITETWLKSIDDSIRAQLCLPGYKFYDRPREAKCGGGTALLYRDSLNISKGNYGQKESFEFSEWILKSTGSCNVRLIILYRPPYSDNHRVPVNVFLNEFSHYMESLVLSKDHLLLVGDFNLHVDVADDADATKFLDLIDSLGLKQHVNKPTHIHLHTLDLVITRTTSTIIQSIPRVDRYFSDHACVIGHLTIGKPSAKITEVTYRKLKSVDVTQFRKDIASSDLCSAASITSDEPSQLVALSTLYDDTLTRLLNQHAPLLKRRVRIRAQVPWYSKEIAEARRQRRRAERVWRRTRLTSDFNLFKKKKNYATFVMNKARQSYYANMIDETGSDQGKLFKCVKNLLAPKDSLHFPDYNDSRVLANDIGEFFFRKINQIRDRLDKSVKPEQIARVPDDHLVSEDQCLAEFKLLSCEDVYNLVKRSAKKTCALDPMPTNKVVDCLDELLPVITSIINSSLASGHFPSEWKEALVDPRLKSGKDIALTNLRPVSNLLYISKLAERAVFDQIHNHMTQFDLYPMLQSAYRSGYSTETALLKVKNDILLTMDKQRVTLLVLLDLSAAFDTIDHQVLLKRLESSFRITGKALRWFASYLTERSQRIVFDGCYFDGSCLGPLLFTIYASKLFDIIRTHLPSVHAFADDTQLYLSFKADSNRSQAEALTAFQDCISSIRDWMTVDKLKLNEDKTEIIIIGTRAQLSKINITYVKVGDTSVAIQNARNDMHGGIGVINIK